MQDNRKLISLPVIIGLGLLIIAAYLDNSRGPLLPHIAKTMGFDYSGSSQFLVLGHLASMIVMFTLFPLLNRYNERAVSWACMALAFLTILYSGLIESRSSLLLFAAAIGTVNSLLGTMSNVVIMAHSTPDRLGRNLALLHVMYGVGSMLGTVVIGQILGVGWPWYYALYGLLPLIILLAWKTRILSDASSVAGIDRRQSATLAIEHWLVIFIFTAYVLGEVLTSMWMTTYLVETDGLSIAEASWYGTAFFISIAVSRALMIVEWSNRKPVRILIACLGLAVLFSFLGIWRWRVFLPLVGVLGPFFPLFLARVTALYPARYRSITLYVFIAMQVVLATMHYLIGYFSASLSISQSYWLAPYALVAALLLLLLHLRLTGVRSLGSVP